MDRVYGVELMELRAVGAEERRKTPLLLGKLGPGEAPIVAPVSRGVPGLRRQLGVEGIYLARGQLAEEHSPPLLTLPLPFQLWAGPKAVQAPPF